MTLSAVAESVRRHDPDRFLTSLFAPADRRQTLLVLYAFNHELARAREVASQPTLALIRLQWWREVVEGVRRRHEVAGPLGEALDTRRLAPDELLEMISAREAEADFCIEDEVAWMTYLRGGAGALARAAGRVLGASGASLELLTDIGAAYGVAGVLRNHPALARQGRCLLPADRLAAVGLSVDAAIAQPHSPDMTRLQQGLAETGLALLPRGPARALPKSALAAGLVGVLARRDLRLCRSGHVLPGAGRLLSDRLAVVLGAWRGQI